MTHDCMTVHNPPLSPNSVMFAPRWSGKMTAFRMTFDALKARGHNVELKQHGSGWIMLHYKRCPRCRTLDSA